MRRRFVGAARGSEDFRSRMLEREAEEREAKIEEARVAREKRMLEKQRARSLDPGEPEVES